ncbi:MAG: hypothetical protein EBR82_43315 [Caulobacteraceae bacterium]|nr:hypothetical protein [Caulobacteraceae bacterium]
MATWVEDKSSRSATIYRLGKKAASTMRRSYKVFGYTDDTPLHADCNQRITGQLMFWQYPGANVQLRAESYTVDYLGDDAWHVEIQYEKVGADASEPDPLKRSRSFDTSGGTQHITQALDNVTVLTGRTGTTTVTQSGERRYPPSTAPSMNGAIGVDGSSVNGVDIVVPALTWTETYDVPSTYVTSGYIRGLAGLTGSVNNASFRGFDAGEVLFVGCSGSQEWDEEKGNGPWTLSFKFVASPNVTNQKIGDITGVEKKGHEYLWVRYEDAVSSNDLVKRPRSVYVNRVYRDGNFSGLGIGS